MSDKKLGNLAEINEGRDAIHIAIVPVVAGHLLLPGEHVGLDDDGMAIKSAKTLGIVDPFLTRNVLTGERFWLCLYQQTVTGMRHAWSHPAFAEEPISSDPTPAMNSVSPEVRAESEKYLRAFAQRCGLRYVELMDAAESYLKTGEMYCFGDTDHEYVSEDFWTHYQNVTGKTGEGNFFRCAC